MTTEQKQAMLNIIEVVGDYFEARLNLREALKSTRDETYHLDKHRQAENAANWLFCKLEEASKLGISLGQEVRRPSIQASQIKQIP